MNAFSRRRRRFLRSITSASTLALLDAFVPSWARTPGVTGGKRQIAAADADVLHLAIDAHRLAVADGTGPAVTVNGTVPGPLLEWHEGSEVLINVQNRMDVDTSIHWHGILLPFEMDGVPGVTFRGIAPGETFQYRFPVRQNGTYWYHGHSGLQEQAGVYGPLVIHPREPEDLAYDRDYVVLLSDWTFDDPHHVLAKLKKMSDYYNYQQFTAADLYGTGQMSRADAWKTKFAWDRMRMMATDILDVTAAGYTYLMNGLHTAGNWTGLFAPGERVRLRFINGSAMTYFNIRVPGLPLTVVAADGQRVQPVDTDEFQLGVAETLDVLVAPGDDEAYTIVAETMDRSGCVAGTLATRPGARATVPPLRRRPLLTMADMGMDHGEGHGATPVAETRADPATDHGAMAGHDASTSAHAGHAMDVAPESSHDAHGAASPGPIVARHGPDHHGPGNIGVAEVQRNRLGDRPTGLGDAEHRVLVYTDLGRLADDFDARPPARDLELHLTGHMERYMWSFDGLRFHEVAGPVEFEYGERLRLVLVNDTMMNHPIHLHGMWMELENGQGSRIPRKHTLNLMPGARVSALVNADAPGRWAFHCHLLYHMHMGMFRVVRVSEPGGAA